MMGVRLHNNVTATPARRVALQALDKPVRVLAQEFGVSEDTIRAWRNREDTADGSHTAHNPNPNPNPNPSTTMTTAQKAIVVTLRPTLCLRRTLWLPLEDLLVATREFVNERASCSPIHRLLQRHI